MKTYARLVRLLAPFRWKIVLSIFLGFATIGAGIGLLAMSAYLISRAALTTQVADLSLAIAAVQLFAVSRVGLRYAERYVTHATTLQILAKLRAWVYASLEPLAPAQLSPRRSGDLLTRLTADIDILEHFYVRSVAPPMVAALVSAMVCLMLGVFNLWLGIALLLFLTLTGAALPLAVERLGREPAAQLVAIRAELNATLVDEIQGIADLMAFGQERRHHQRVMALSRQLNHIQERLARIRGLGIALGTLLAGLAGLTVLGLAIPLVNQGRIASVLLALLPISAIASFEAVQPLTAALHNLEASGASARRLFEIVDLEPAVMAAAPLIHESGPTACSHDCSLLVQHLHFAYAAGEARVLDDVSFSLPDQGRLVIVGPSGAGKSTLVSILLRFWDYQAGSITIGGRELKDGHPDSVRALMSVVAQDTYLFSGTLRDNLLLADPDADDARITAACSKAELGEFVESLPQGYDTWIGENGVLLSGGERQRLAIARAILKDSPILLLDEATAHLDPVTEKAVWHSLRQLMVGRTTLILAHKEPRLIPPAGHLLLLEQGRVIEKTVRHASSRS
jgi:ATP-binding cassette, subfamily C, bacterial CydC